MSQSLRAMLRACATQFARYAENHEAKAAADKNPQVAHTDRVKAEVNRSFVRAIESTLDAADVPGVELDHRRMVAGLQKPGEAILEQMTPLKIMCLHMAGGAASEGGELFDAIKRWALFDKELDRANVVEELGDLEFFMEGLRQNLHITREETLAANHNKLVSGVAPRYPGGTFSDEATIARADKQTGLDLTSVVGVTPGEPDAETSAEIEELRIAEDKYRNQIADMTPEDER